ncbi:MAG: RICIN domain-containing protein [Reichenbachiella sp.]
MKKFLIGLLTIATVSSFAVESGKKYTIKSVLSNKCIDVEGASTAWGANVQQYNCNGSSAQMWDIDLFSTTEVFEVKNENSGRIIGALSAESGTNVMQIYTWSENYGARLWSFVSHGDDVYTIENEGTGNPSQRTCLDVSGANTQSGANIQIWGCNDSDAQKFIITEISESSCALNYGGYGNLKNKNSGKYLDVTGASFEAGANIQQYERNNTVAQAFSIQPRYNEGVRFKCFSVIKNSSNQLVLDVAHGGHSDNVQQWPLVGEMSGEDWNDNQTWLFVPVMDEYNTYFIKARSDQCLEVENGNTQNGANVRTIGCNGSDAQKWVWIDRSPT